MSIYLHTDLPTLDDQLHLNEQVFRMCERIKTCRTPHVLGVHGDWGSGKTSFMRQLQLKLGGDMPTDASVDDSGTRLSAAEQRHLQKSVITIWFDAWRFQNEPAPVVALLQEMRRQMSSTRAVMEKLKKLGSVATISILDSLSSIGKTISLDNLPNIEKIEKRGQQWEKENFHEALTSNSIREHLCEVIKCLLPTPGSRVIVFIDDLDRCSPKAAIRLLEGLKIYLTVPNCVFVLGMNERIMVDAIRDEISAPKDISSDELRLRAGHYFEKICTDIFRLPLPSVPIALLAHWIHDIEHKQALQLAVGRLSCLPPNPRRLKALANQWGRFATCVAFPAEVELQKIWAVRVLVATYIHQFHRDLWERWHFNPDFWEEILALCNGDLNAPLPEWARSLRMTFMYTNTGSNSERQVFPNPGDIDNFWIGSLVRAYKDHLYSRDFRELVANNMGAN